MKIQYLGKGTRPGEASRTNLAPGMGDKENFPPRTDQGDSPTSNTHKTLCMSCPITGKNGDLESGNFIQAFVLLLASSTVKSFEASIICKMRTSTAAASLAKMMDI